MKKEDFEKLMLTPVGCAGMARMCYRLSDAQWHTNRMTSVIAMRAAADLEYLARLLEKPFIASDQWVQTYVKVDKKTAAKLKKAKRRHK